MFISFEVKYVVVWIWVIGFFDCFFEWIRFVMGRNNVIMWLVFFVIILLYYLIFI